MAMILSIREFQAKKGRPFPAVPIVKAPRLPVMSDKSRSGFIDNVLLMAWSLVFGISWLVRFPLACWVVIEWIRSWFGYPVYHAVAYLALLIAIYIVPVFYTPKALR